MIRKLGEMQPESAMMRNPEQLKQKLGSKQMLLSAVETQGELRYEMR